MAFPPFPKRRDYPSSKAFSDPRHPGPGENTQLGPFGAPIFDPKQLNNPFVSQKDNPDPRGFATNSRFDDETAARSFEKISNQSLTDYPSFGEEDRNIAATSFLEKYAQSVDRGLIGEDERISSATLGRIASQPAAAGSNERSPNTAGKFPNQGVNV